jgi:UDP-N-acetylmuramoyl-tripeptide--D-alanyl-D-alanine ligase
VGAAEALGAWVESFGAGEANSLRLLDVDLQHDATVVRALLDGEAQLFRLATAGRHFAANALGVLGVVRALGADVTLAARDMSLWQPPAGRGMREEIMLDPVEELSLTLIDDAYNANPTSMAAALEVLAASHPVDGVGRIERGRRLAVLGDMLELGADERAMHEALADLPFLAKVDMIHCVGPLMQALWQRLPAEKQGLWAETAAEMAGRIHHLIDAGDVLMVKGSLGSRVSLVVDAVRKLGHPLDG